MFKIWKIFRNYEHHLPLRINISVLLLFFVREFLNSIVHRLSHIWISGVCTIICSIVRSMNPSKARVCQQFVQKYWGFRSPRFVSQNIYLTSAFVLPPCLCLLQLLCGMWLFNLGEMSFLLAFGEGFISCVLSVVFFLDLFL